DRIHANRRRECGSQPAPELGKPSFACGVRSWVAQGCSVVESPIRPYLCVDRRHHNHRAVTRNAKEWYACLRERKWCCQIDLESPTPGHYALRIKRNCPTG